MSASDHDRSLLEQAFVDARLQKSAEAELNTEDISLSDEHRQKMQFILKSTPKTAGRSGRRKRPIAMLIASLIATLTLAAIASMAIAKRSEIADFMDGLFDNGSAEPHTTQPSRPQEIEQIYSISHIPEGYSVSEALSDSESVRTVWHNSSDAFIVFEQSVHVFSDDLPDGQGKRETIQIGSLEIECIYLDEYSIFRWTYAGYSFKLECSNALPFDEISQMILSFVKSNLPV